MAPASHEGSLGPSRAMRRKRDRSGENGTGTGTTSYAHSKMHHPSTGGDTLFEGMSTDEVVGPAENDKGGNAEPEGTHTRGS